MITKISNSLQFVAFLGLIATNVLYTQSANASHVCICIFDNPHFAGLQFPNDTEAVCDEESCNKLCETEVQMPHPWRFRTAQCALDDSLLKISKTKSSGK